jgi:hypothetical protein
LSFVVRHSSFVVSHHHPNASRLINLSGKPAARMRAWVTSMG